MAGATRFLYGLALGVSLGFIGSKLFAASSGGHRRAIWSGRQRPAARTPRRTRPREEAVAR
jgi:hypothetical protein